MKRPLILLLILIAAFLLSCVPDAEGQVRVVRVIDGDTIEMKRSQRSSFRSHTGSDGGGGKNQDGIAATCPTSFQLDYLILN